MVIDQQPQLILPPSPFIRRLGEKLRYGPLDILDVGCCMGRNALYLSSLGNRVIGVDVNHSDLKFARSINNQRLSVVQADARNLPFNAIFDVVLMNEVIHMIPDSERQIVLDGLKRVTKPTGIHAISGYIGDKPHALHSGELYGAYANPAWEIIESFEDDPSLISYGQSQELNSLASIIAIKR